MARRAIQAFRRAFVPLALVGPPRFADLSLPNGFRL